MEIVTGSTGQVHVTPIDDAVRNSNVGYLNGKAVFTYLRNFEAISYVNNEIRVFSGYGMNQGRMFKIDDEEWDSVTVESGSQGYKRADLIVARYHMDSQTGFESITLEVIRGTAGSAYVDPSYITGDINAGEDDDFPLYRVRMNGLTIEGLDRLFTPIPDGGRLGELEAQVRAHKTAFDALNIRTNLASESSVYPKNGANVRPGVEGILPASHGGTGKANLKDSATDLVNALDSNGTTPADGDYYVGTTPSTTGYQRKPLSALWSWISSKLGSMGYGDMTKGEFCNNPDSELPTVKVEKGGTGQTTLNGIRNALGLGNDVTKPLPYDKGGTGITQKPSILVNLASESATDVYQATPRPGITGTLALSHGGTGATTVAGARNALKLGNTDGAVPIANGGTGATTVAGARNALKLGNTDGAVPVANGGTGATTASAARTNLGVAYGTAAGTVCQGNDSRLSNKREPTSHASTGTGYGVGTSSAYGHLKITDSPTTSHTAASGVAASGKVVANISTAVSDLEHTAVNKAGDTFTGDVTIYKSGGTKVSYLTLGASSDSSGGAIRIYENVNERPNSKKYLTFGITEATANRAVTFPNKSGTVQVSDSSSRRVKENIKDMTEDKAKKLLDINVVDFDYIGEFGGGLKDQCGVIAEDILDIIPEAVEIAKRYDESKPVDEEKNPAPSVDYRKFVPYLIKMVQMQQKEIEELKAMIK